MADPISIAAIAGLIYAGRTMSKSSMGREKYTPPPPPSPPPSGVSEPVPPELVEIPIQTKTETSNFGDITQQRGLGGDILGMRNRMYDTGRMNNLSPVEKQLVGPGLGVSPETPAQGGYQQLFRVNPINVGEHRLTTLPGRSGPAGDITGGRAPVVGILGHNRPEKTVHIPSRHPVMAGRAQGMSGMIPRQEHEKTKRTTNRSETGHRGDGLGFNGAKRVVSAQTLIQDPTRFKSDRNDKHYAYHNHAAPGVSNFTGAYATSAAAQMMAKTNEELMKYGFRPEDRRGKANRMGNKGRMNVRENALKQGGALTSVRTDTTRIDGRTNPANGGWMQNYQVNPFHQFNAYKGNENPHAKTLDVAKNQLKNNPLAQHVY